MRYLLLLALWPVFTFAVTPRDTTPPRERLKKGAQITISRYIEASDAFEITLSATPDVGPNYATPEDLHDALGLTNSLSEFKRRTINNDIGRENVLRRELLLLWPVELKIRAKKKH